MSKLGDGASKTLKSDGGDCVVFELELVIILDECSWAKIWMPLLITSFAG